jgi:tetratricopeptide (TPR) repeat protein
MKKIPQLVAMTLLYGFTLSASPIFPEIKIEIQKLQKLLDTESSKQEKAQKFYELAIAHLKDQELDKAFYCFLNALDLCQVQPRSQMRLEENLIYEEALGTYLQGACCEPQETAEHILKKYEGIAKNCLDFFDLQILVAAAHANLGNYEQFFDSFFSAYPFVSDSFLSHKTRGILYLRLAQNSVTREEKAHHREDAIAFLQKSLEKNPKDASLYRVLVFLANEDKNDLLLLECLHKIVDEKVAIPRADVYLYVRECVAMEEYELAQKMIDAAKAQFPYSRTAAAAQDYLNQHKEELSYAGTNPGRLQNP